MRSWGGWRGSGGRFGGQWGLVGIPRAVFSFGETQGVVWVPQGPSQWGWGAVGSEAGGPGGVLSPLTPRRRRSRGRRAGAVGRLQLCRVPGGWRRPSTGPAPALAPPRTARLPPASTPVGQMSGSTAGCLGPLLDAWVSPPTTTPGALWEWVGGTWKLRSMSVLVSKSSSSSPKGLMSCSATCSGATMSPGLPCVLRPPPPPPQPSHPP